MAGGNVKYTFQVDANTAQAKKALDELKRSMDQLVNAQAGKSFFDENINKAVESAKELKYHLNQAMDVNTGQLNLNAFNKSLKEAGQSSTQLMQNLLNGGAQGQQTFVALAGAIAQADVPIRRMNQGLRDFGTTLKNTVKWELSSGLVHGLVSSISGAVSYAKNLNSSLTDIRIVTGKSVEDMTRFAEQANKAAKSLSTTTKAYTDASLIYYQQGDSEEAVKKKTEITLKAANASVKTSAAEMSEYLTAVWNSYQVGADELERYVDIMAALGAKTATSLEEIATSMQKVAATGNTVGVSMEQVSSIIATVSSVTRESAESIGTSYKTIFARMGDLKLGAKDEDGIGLGQVSKSLESIGVEVLDASGDLREMGDIITDLGDKWQGMSKAEKTAIAQVVAGKRQYTQLMALFENWDMYQQNMSIAQDSDGSLQKMQDIQAQSWEAAANRQKAAMESIYSQVINDQAMIKFTDGITGAIEGISGLIDAFGGLGGVVTKFGSIATAVFQKSLVKGIDSAVTSMTTFFSQFQGKNMKEIFGMFKGNQIKNREQIEFDRYNQQFTNDLNKMKFADGSSQATAVNNARELMSLKQQLINSEHKLSDAQKQRALSSIGELSQEQNKLVQMVQEYEQLDVQLKKVQKSQQNSFFAANRRTYDQIMGSPQTQQAAIDELNNDLLNQNAFLNSRVANNRYLNNGGYSDAGGFDSTKLFAGLKNAANDIAVLDVAEQNITQIARSTATATEKTKLYADVIETLKTLLSGEIDGATFENLEQDVTKLEGKIKKLREEAALFTGDWTKMANNVLKGDAGAAAMQAVDEINDQATKKANAAFSVMGQRSILDRTKEGIKNLLDSNSESYKNFSKAAASVVGSTMAIADGALSAERAVQTFGDESATAGQKLMALSSGMSSLLSGFMSGGPIGFALTFIAMTISGIVAHVQQMKKEFQEAQQLKFDELTSDIGEKNTEMETNAGLIQSYNSLYETYISTGEGQDALAESARALAEAYGLVGANVLIASGNFEAFNKMLLDQMGFTELEQFYAKKERELFDNFITGEEDPYSKYAVEPAGITTGKLAWNVHTDSELGGPGYEEVLSGIRGDLGYNAQGILSQLGTKKNRQEYEFDIDQIDSVYQRFKEMYGSNTEMAMGMFKEFLRHTDASAELIDSFASDAVFSEGQISELLTKNGEPFKLTGSLKGNNNLTEWANMLNNTIYEHTKDILASAGEDMKQFDVSEFFDEWGNMKGVETGEGLYKQWKNLQSRLEEVKVEKGKIAEQLADETIVGADREVLEAQLKYYEGIEELYSGTLNHEDNADIVDYVKQLDQVKDQQRKITILKKNLSNFMGQSEANTSFEKFVEYTGSVNDTIDEIANTYDELNIYLEKDANGEFIRDGEGFKVIDKFKDEYEQAKMAVASEFIKSYTAFDDFLYIYQDIIGVFGEDSSQVLDLVQQEGIKKASQITASLMAAMQEAIDKNIDLDQSAMVQQILDTNKKRAEYDSNLQKSDTINKAIGMMSEDMGIEEATSVASLWQNDEINNQLMDWDNFIKMDYDGRIEYLQSIADMYQNSAYDTADAVAKLSAQNYTDWEQGLNKSKEDLEASQAYFDDFYAYLQKNEETKGWTWDAQNQVFMDGEEIVSALQLGRMRRQYRDDTGAKPKAWTSILSDMRTLETGRALESERDSDRANADAIALMNTDGVETKAERLERYSKAINTLSSEMTNFSKTGKLSANAMAAFQEVGIKPSDIKTMNDYTQALSKLTNARIEEQKMEYEAKYGSYDENKIWTDQQIKDNEAQYNAWLAVKNLQIENANLSQTIFENAIANGETQISAMEARVNKLKEDAEKTKEIAEILESSIESGELSYQQQAELNAKGFDLKGWNDATTAMERANIVAKQYSQYAIDIAKASEETSTFYSNAADNLRGFDKSNLNSIWGDLSSQGNFDKLISGMVQYQHMTDDVAAAWEKAYKTMSQQTDGFAGMSNTEIISSIRGELERLGKDAGDAGLIAAATAKDRMHEAFRSLADENAAAADAAVNAWEDAFNRIAELRKKILSGENIQDDIFGQGIDNLLQAFLSSGESDYNTFSTAVKTGKYKPDLPTFNNINQFWSSIGLDSYLMHGTQNMRDLGIYYAQQADVQGLTGSEKSAYILEQSKSDVNALLNTFLGYYGTEKDQQNDIINSWLVDDTKSLYDYNGGLVTATELINNAAQILQSTKEMFSDMRSYTETEELATTLEARQLNKGMLIDQNGNIVTDPIGSAFTYDRMAEIFDIILANHDKDYESDMALSDLRILKEAGLGFGDMSAFADYFGGNMLGMAQANYQQALSMAGGAEAYAIDQASGLHYNTTSGTSDPVAEQLDQKLQEWKEIRQKVEDGLNEIHETDIEQLDIDPKAWESMTESIEEAKNKATKLGKLLADNLDKTAAKDIAKDILRWDKAIEQINDSYSDWNKTLNSGTEDEKAKQIKELDKAYSDMLDLDYGMLSDEFLKNADNLDLMKKAAKGSEEAYNDLRDAAHQDIISNMILQTEDFSNAYDDVTSKMEAMDFQDIEVGASLNSAPFLAALTDMVNAAGLTASQATSLLSSMGIDATIVPKTETVTDTGTLVGAQPHITMYAVPGTNPLTGAPMTYFFPDVDYTPTPVPTSAERPMTGFGLKVESASKSSGGNVKTAGGGGGSGGGGGGGGGGKKKQIKPYKRPKDETKRYHRNNSAITQVGNELKKLSAAKDAAYGKNYVDAIDAETAALRREREEQEKLRQEALSYKNTDAAKLIAAGAQIGENGVIENYDDLMQSWINEYNAAVDAWNNSDQDEDDQEKFDEANQLYEDRLQLIQDYEDALDTAADAEARLQEILNEISENTLEGITYTLELELEVNERDLELLEYYREQYEDTLEDQDNLFANLMQQANEYETNFASLQDAYNNLMAEYNSGNLQEDEYAEGLADLHSQILENLQNLQDIKEQIAEVYSNALDLATEEIENATEALDHMNETMEAYIAIMGLSGRETDYATMQAFYDAQFATNMANIESQTKFLAGLKAQEEYFKNRKEQNGELTDLEEKEYNDLMKKIRETESAVLESTQTTLEVLRAGYENTINRIAQELDEFMAGAAGSISHLQEQYAYFQEEQGRYVSTAKELYEVSSLNREIENTLAETTSAASKEALKALQEKINKQSELNEMTEYDIEMNQLEYQLLLARIQLEEAQNSKDTVRLTRDNNGNYAYQYTADEDKVSEAMQNYEDTLQEMNDLTVERTSEIEQQMINSMAEYKEKMQEIAMDTTLSESEKYERMLELQSQFDAEMAYLQEQAGIANENLLANQTAIADHYGVNITTITSSTAGNVNQTVQDMIANAQEYSVAMHNALFGPDGVSQSWSDYLAAVTTVQQASGTTINDMLNNTANVGEVNEEAVQSALDAVEALSGTLEPINQMTEAWNMHQEALQGTIDSYEDLLVHINDLMVALGQTDTEANLDPEGTNIDSSTRASASMPEQNSVEKDKKKPQYGKDYFDEITEKSFEEAAAEAHMDTLAEWMNQLVDHYLEVHEEVVENDELTEQEKYKQLEELQQNYEKEMEILRDNYKKQQGEYEEVLTDFGDAYNAWLDHINTLTHMNMLNNYHAPGLNNEAPVVIDQNVTIEAEFPNVSSTDEIIEAFNELINRAAQFASSKK